MSMPEIQKSYDLTDFHVEKNVETCACPAVTYVIYDRSMYEYTPEAAMRGLVEHYVISVPGLKIDEFSVVLFQLDKLLCNDIFPSYGESVTERFLEEFIEQFYPEKEYEFIVKFGKDVCIIDNVQNDGESSADFALAGRQLAVLEKSGKLKKGSDRKPLKEFLND